MSPDGERPVLVTGAGGFVGPFVLEQVRQKGQKVVAACHLPEEHQRLSQQGVSTVHFDLEDPSSIENAVQLIKPGGVIHLAAQSNVAVAFQDPLGTHRVNHLGVVALLEALARHAQGVRVLFISSATVYGRVRPEALPLHEDTPLRPVDAYGASKGAAELACLAESARGRLRVVIARPFNHTGPGQSDGFVCSAFARQVAAIRRGEAPPRLQVGDLSPRRDFTDVRDIARAYLDLWEGGENGVIYNLCSGVSRPVGDILEELVRVAGVEVEVERDESRVRPVDLPDLRGDVSRFRNCFGWAPPPIGPGTLGDLLTSWDARDRKGPSAKTLSDPAHS